MIATEENGTTEDEVYAFLEKVGHPAVTMTRFLDKKIDAAGGARSPVLNGPLALTFEPC